MALSWDGSSWIRDTPKPVQFMILKIKIQQLWTFFFLDFCLCLPFPVLKINTTAINQLEQTLHCSYLCTVLKWFEPSDWGRRWDGRKNTTFKFLLILFPVLLPFLMTFSWLGWLSWCIFQTDKLISAASLDVHSLSYEKCKFKAASPP